MKHGTTGAEKVTIGLDLGDKYSYVHILGSQGKMILEFRVRTLPEDLERSFRTYKGARVAIEAGTHSPWVSRLLGQCGLEVLVANPRQLRLIYGNPRKRDKADARYLAHLALLDPELLAPIKHRDLGVQVDLGVLRARDNLVAQRTKLVNHVRGAVKSFGARVPRCSTHCFDQVATEYMPKELWPALGSVVLAIGGLTDLIRDYDKLVERRCKEKYPETGRLTQVPGVGPVTALAYVLVLGDPRRFARSRNVGAYLGLAPRRDDTGERESQLGISKTGDGFLRRLLVGSAHYILGPFGPDADLRRYGQAIAQKGAKNAKKRAVTAVARKLAVLLHRLWLEGGTYEPLRNTERKRGKRGASGRGEAVAAQRS